MSIPGNTSQSLGPWMLTSSVAGHVAEPGLLAQHQWLANVPVPGTVAQALRAAGTWNLQTPRDFDAEDWWYRCNFTHAEVAGTRYILRLQGLATLAHVWLNGQPLLTSENMFHAHALDVTAQLRAHNELVIVFRALHPALAQRRPRPRWKTKLVSHQQLRWLRTTLLGRIPGWSPPVAPVGPWRAITLERRDETALAEIELHPYLAGDLRVLEFRALFPAQRDVSIAATLYVGNVSTAIEVVRGEHGYTLAARLTNSELGLWWPHTLGDPVLHTCRVVISVNDREVELNLGQVGFRRIEVNTRLNDFEFSVNGMPLFCRGACWTSNDVVSLTGNPETLTRTLQLARAAHMNMLRIGGTMVYEQDAFYERCDELGILVWQDFIFANMDYPVEDAAFRASVEREATQQLQRLRRHACIAIYCGNSEVEQQAAMLGMPREAWRNPLFAQILPELIERWHPGTPYVPSTPSGGVMPFHTRTGITHYYGVGAYLRAVAQVRRDDVKFTAECLGFSNVPELDIIDELMGGDLPVTHHPLWKARVPRDSAAGWDFEDVRDHYVGELFKIDPVQLRCFDTARYLALGRVATGEMMAQVYAEWRSTGSHCRGALVWFLQDLWPGAGWGVLDSHGLPKACYYYLRRAWQPVAIVLTDEGLDGIHAHVVNESSQAVAGTLEFRLLHGGHTLVANGSVECSVAPRSKTVFAADAVLQGFYDVGYVYRFGPPKHEVVIASLRGTDGAVLHEACFFPQSHAVQKCVNTGVTAQAHAEGEGLYRLMLSSPDFLYAVRIETKGYLPQDNYFHLVPGQERSLLCRKIAPGSVAFKGYIEALNLEDTIKIQVQTIHPHE